MFEYLEQTLIGYAQSMPLEYFAFFASFAEEVIAPIPSPAIMIAVGSLASVQHYTLYGLVLLSLAGTVGKTLGGLVVYTIADKAEDLILKSPFARFLRISHSEIESLGARLGNGVWDYVILTTLRALPIVPSVLISVGSGVLKVPLRLYLTATLIGTVIRDGIYVYFGYMGLKSLGVFIEKSASVESYLEIISVIGIAVVFFVVWYRRRTPSV